MWESGVGTVVYKRSVATKIQSRELILMMNFPKSYPDFGNHYLAKFYVVKNSKQLSDILPGQKQTHATGEAPLKPNSILDIYFVFGWCSGNAKGL